MFTIEERLFMDEDLKDLAKKVIESAYEIVEVEVREPSSISKYLGSFINMPMDRPIRPDDKLGFLSIEGYYFDIKIEELVSFKKLDKMLKGLMEITDLKKAIDKNQKQLMMAIKQYEENLGKAEDIFHTSISKYKSANEFIDSLKIYS